MVFVCLFVYLYIDITVVFEEDLHAACLLFVYCDVERAAAALVEGIDVSAFT